MNPKRQNVHWAAGSVIGWIDDVLKVQSCKDILNHRSVVVNLTNAFW
jgi:hypothetical protein